MMAAPGDDREISSVKVSPRYLESNATCHTWAFSAFAELIDNSCDAKAKEVDIDELIVHNSRCLSIQDDGWGMDADKLHHMLSFGYSEAHKRDHIGMYGNGFKSGSMRLGKDVLVFTRTAQSAGIGLLSQTYLKAIDADNVLVPMLHYTFPGVQPVEHRGRDTSLNAILQHSPFRNEEELINKLTAFTGTGTLIIIYNLRKVDKYDRIELDFSKDLHDIRCPDLTMDGQQDAVNYRNSLREYCSILYLHPRMKMKIRGTYVKTRLIDKSLRNAKIDEYKPNGGINSYKITFGQMPGSDRSGDYGIMFYRENRLIKPYEKVTCQRQNDVGVGIVGVADAGFLTPIHNKQDFVRNEKFLAAVASYSIKLKKYCTDNCTTSSSNSGDTDWVQCDYKECLKWRRLPHGFDLSTLPEKWYCYLHPHGIDCSFPEDVHFADEKIKRGRKKRQENDNATRLQAKRKSMDGGAESNVTPSKQPKISTFLQLGTASPGSSGQDVKHTGSVNTADTPAISSTSGETSKSSTLRPKRSLRNSFIIDGQPAPRSGDSSERHSSEHVDGGAGSSVTGDGQLLINTAREDNPGRGDNSTDCGSSSREDNSAMGYNSNRGDNFTSIDMSSRGHNSTMGRYSTKGDKSSREDTSNRGDNSIQDGYFTRGDISNIAGRDNSRDYSNMGGNSNGGDIHYRGDNSVRADNSARGINSVNGGDTAYGDNSANSKQSTDQSCSFITKQNGDCPNSNHNSLKRKCPDIKVEPAGESSEITIKSEPVGEICHNSTKLADNQGYIVVVPSRKDEISNPEITKLRVKLNRQIRLAGERTAVVHAHCDRKIADLQKHLNDLRGENSNLRNQLQKFSNNVRKLLRRLRPHEVIDNNANIEQTVDNMLASTT